MYDAQWLIYAKQFTTFRHIHKHTKATIVSAGHTLIVSIWLGMQWLWCGTCYEIVYFIWRK